MFTNVHIQSHHAIFEVDIQERNHQCYRFMVCPVLLPELGLSGPQDSQEYSLPSSPIFPFFSTSYSQCWLGALWSVSWRRASSFRVEFWLVSTTREDVLISSYVLLLCWTSHVSIGASNVPSFLNAIHSFTQCVFCYLSAIVLTTFQSFIQGDLVEYLLCAQCFLIHY